MLEFIDVLAIDTMDRFSFSEVAKLCHLSREEAQELIDYGAIKSDYSIGSECFFRRKGFRFCKMLASSVVTMTWTFFLWSYLFNI